MHGRDAMRVVDRCEVPRSKQLCLCRTALCRAMPCHAMPCVVAMHLQASQPAKNVEFRKEIRKPVRLS